MTAQDIKVQVQYIQKNHLVEATQFDDEWILLNTDDYTVTKLNELGGYCWSLLSDAQTVESLTQAIATEFGMDSSNDMAEKDIEDFVAELIQYGLIQDVH